MQRHVLLLLLPFASLLWILATHDAMCKYKTVEVCVSSEHYVLRTRRINMLTPNAGSFTIRRLTALCRWRWVFSSPTLIQARDR